MDSNIRAEVVSIGTELVLGQILDKPFPPSEERGIGRFSHYSNF